MTGPLEQAYKDRQPKGTYVPHGSEWHREVSLIWAHLDALGKAASPNSESCVRGGGNCPTTCFHMNMGPCAKGRSL